MENDKKCECAGHGMGCGMCGHHHWSHLVIKALIILFVFWAGMEFGEVRALVHGNYGYQRFSPVMMDGGGYVNVRGGAANTSATPATPAPTPAQQ